MGCSVHMVSTVISSLLTTVNSWTLYLCVHILFDDLLFCILYTCIKRSTRGIIKHLSHQTTQQKLLIKDIYHFSLKIDHFKCKKLHRENKNSSHNRTDHLVFTCACQIHITTYDKCDIRPLAQTASWPFQSFMFLLHFWTSCLSPVTEAFGF